MKRITIFRGLPGSGKTSLADYVSGMSRLAGRDGRCIGADDYPGYYYPGGTYTFTPETYRDAHAWMRGELLGAMRRGTIDLFVHEVFAPEDEFAWIYEAAERYGYEVHSVIVENRHGSRDTHNVPSDTLVRMEDDFDICLRKGAPHNA